MDAKGSLNTGAAVDWGAGCGGGGAAGLGIGAMGLGTALGGGTMGMPGMAGPGIGTWPGAGAPGRDNPRRAFRSAISLPGPGFFGCSKTISPCVRWRVTPGCSPRGEGGYDRGQGIPVKGRSQL